MFFLGNNTTFSRVAGRYLNIFLLSLKKKKKKSNAYNMKIFFEEIAFNSIL